MAREKKAERPTFKIFTEGENRKERRTAALQRESIHEFQVCGRASDVLAVFIHELHEFHEFFYSKT
jgi:hypothetical protein